MKTYEIICARCKIRKSAGQFPVGENGRHKRICTKCTDRLGKPKQCTTCGKTKELDQFHNQGNAPDGRSYNCKDCVRDQGRNWNESNRDRLAKVRSDYYEANREKIRKDQAAKHRERKIRVLRAYGGRCVCCGEKNLGLLTLDHINGDGAAHRKSLGHEKASSRIYAWAEANGFPDLLQALCWNCNNGSWHNKGICPHKDDQWVKLSVEDES